MAHFKTKIDDEKPERRKSNAKFKNPLMKIKYYPRISFLWRECTINGQQKQEL